MDNEMKQFLKTNRLTQDVLGTFLGVTAQYINRIATGRTALPHHQWARIRAHEEWDSSMLSEPTAPAQEYGESRPKPDQAGRLIGLLEKKDEQIDRLLGIIEQLSK